MSDSPMQDNFEMWGLGKDTLLLANGSKYVYNFCLEKKTGNNFFARLMFSKLPASFPCRKDFEILQVTYRPTKLLVRKVSTTNFAVK